MHFKCGSLLKNQSKLFIDYPIRISGSLTGLPEWKNDRFFICPINFYKSPIYTNVKKWVLKYIFHVGFKIYRGSNIDFFIKVALGSFQGQVATFLRKNDSWTMSHGIFNMVPICGQNLSLGSSFEGQFR